MKNLSKKNIALYTVALFFLGVFITRYWEDFQNIKIVNPLAILPVTLFMFLFLIVNGLVNYIILRGYSVPVSLGVSVGLTSANAVGNLILPMRGGTVSNAVFLRKKYNFSYSLFLALLSAIYIIIFWTSSLFGIIVMVLQKHMRGQDIPINLFIFFVLVFIFFSVIILFSPEIPLTKYNFINKFIQILNNWQLINKNREIIASLIFLTILNILITALFTYFEFILIGEEIAFDKLIIYAIFSGFSLLVSITPGNIGIRESFSMYSALVLGITLPVVLVVSVVDRFFSFIISILALAITARFIRIKKSSNQSF